MIHIRQYRGWILTAAIAALMLGVLILGMSIASAQTATPAATDAATGTVSATGTTAATGTAEVTGTAAATSTAGATGTARPTGTAAATDTAGGTATPTAASATAAPTGAATSVATPRGTATVTGSLQITLPAQSYLPLDLALQAASAALEECSDQGYRVTVTVVDRSGVEKVVLKGDGAGPHTLGSSFKKAFTAASLGSATSALVTRVQGDATLAALADMDERIILLGGGLPIRVGNEVVGGIGVGGAPSGAIDAGCAQVGLDSLAEKSLDQ